MKGGRRRSSLALVLLLGLLFLFLLFFLFLLALIILPVLVGSCSSSTRRRRRLDRSSSRYSGRVDESGPGSCGRQDGTQGGNLEAIVGSPKNIALNDIEQSCEGEGSAGMYVRGRKEVGGRRKRRDQRQHTPLHLRSASKAVFMIWDSSLGVSSSSGVGVSRYLFNRSVTSSSSAWWSSKRVL
jgi:hypothetical protein